MQAPAAKRGVRVSLNASVDSLVTENSVVRGVTVRTEQGQKRVLARGGVVLAGGDFSANSQLRAELAGEAAGRLSPVNPTATGAGIELRSVR